MARKRDYKREYQQRQAKAQKEGFKSYGAKRWSFSKRARLERQAERRYVQHFGRLVNRKTVRKGMRFHTDAELQRMVNASASQLRNAARQVPSYVDPDTGREFNPYWYH